MKHKEITDELQEQASLYAAGAMSDSERAEYARHLEVDDCAACQSEVDELQAAVSLLAFTANSASPSPGVKARLMEQARNAPPLIHERQSAFGWLQWVTAAVAVASIVVAFTVTRTNTELRRAVDETNSTIAQLEVELAGQRNSMAALMSARVVDLAGQGTNVAASGRIFWSREEKKWFFSVRGLPPVSADKSYQLWFVPNTGNPVSATVFNTAADGSARIEIPVPDAVTDLKAAAVTTEPSGGLPQPSGAYALLGAL